MAFVPKPKQEEQTVTLTVTLPQAHHARLVAVGSRYSLPPEEVLVQFIGWAIDAGELGGKKTRSKSAKAPKKASK